MESWGGFNSTYRTGGKQEATGSHAALQHQQGGGETNLGTAESARVER